ncbi:AAA family ATPase [Pseudoalteromonas sp. DL2-H2.2]|uniref:AAA family ATPase n=1 Tax=Pseudoalteromonas sp. DL2-H2.2 TaxID=2908889 RepID=UPI001F319B62|nr:AAA family ATPase [Pseudoalteromonas sp. DL2-H2.2]MCF2910791.1 AAA family ATPase [Pseudoalteromonas sp. DL2-H2.2]
MDKIIDLAGALSDLPHVKEEPNKNYIKMIELKGIHKRYDLTVEFNQTLNILYGQNGTGKTTLIHIISNLANCDFIRFAFIEFANIKIVYSNSPTILISRNVTSSESGYRGGVIQVHVPENDSTLKFSMRDAMESAKDQQLELFSDEPASRLSDKVKKFVTKNNLNQISASYFPAFRTLLEAWSSRKRENRSMGKYAVEDATTFARELFGQFLPRINYPSPLEIEKKLVDEIISCQVSIGRYENSIFSSSFIGVFSALLTGKDNDSNPTELLKEISTLTKESTNNKFGDYQEYGDVYERLRELIQTIPTLSETSVSGALEVYRDALKEKVMYQEEAFLAVNSYLEVVNFFLENKELSYELSKERRRPTVGLKFPDGSWSNIKVMSSGERQLLTMLYAVNRMSGFSTVLIDEPEISLHIDWQEDLLEKMMEQLGNRQIIVCTHSPSIAADFDEYMKEIAPDFIEFEGDNFNSDDEENV